MPSNFRPVWGISSELPSDIVPGRLYICTDTREILLDTESGDRISLNSLTDLPGVLPIESGGTNADSVSGARGNLHTPAQFGVQPDMGLPIGYGLLSCRDYLGNTSGIVPVTDNYYYGVDMQAVLWGGAQVNGASNPTFYRAMMMNGEQRFQLLWSGQLYSGNGITLTDGYHYSMLLIGAETAGSSFYVGCAPGGTIGDMRILGTEGYYLDIEIRVNSPALNVRVIGGNNSAGHVEYIWGILKHTV